jgi:hypothetical protein
VNPAISPPSIEALASRSSRRNSANELRSSQRRGLRGGSGEGGSDIFWHGLQVQCDVRALAKDHKELTSGIQPADQPTPLSECHTSRTAPLKGKKQIMIIGAVMTKLLHIIYGVLKSRKPFDPAYHLKFAAQLAKH